VDEREAKDLPELPLATSFIGKTLYAIPGRKQLRRVNT